jgi:hypothetical protein
MKNLNVTIKKYYDNENGNTYFAGTLEIDKGTETEKTYLLPFQYGYGSQWYSETIATLSYFNEIEINGFNMFREYIKNNSIVYTENIMEDCTEQELLDLVNGYNSTVEYIRNKRS